MEKTIVKNKLELTHQPNPNPQPDNTMKVYFWLIVCSFMMFTLPFAAFFIVKVWLREAFHIDGFENTCWSTFAAVIVVNLIICFYAYLAYIEDRNENPENENKNKKEK